MKVGVVIVILLIALCGSWLVKLWIDKSELQEQLEATKQEVAVEKTAVEQSRDKNSSYREAVQIDEAIMQRYQKSIDACRLSTEALLEGDYTSALIHAKDVGETEEDVQPLLEERQKLLQGTNAELL